MKKAHIALLGRLGIVVAAGLFIGASLFTACQGGDNTVAEKRIFHIMLLQPETGGTFKVAVGNAIAGTDNVRAEAGKLITLTATPNEDWEFASFTVRAGNARVPAEGTGNKWTFTMPAFHVLISAAFTDSADDNSNDDDDDGTSFRLNIVADPSVGGVVHTAPLGKASEGTTVYVSTVANTGYQLENITVKTASGNVPFNLAGTFGTFSMPAENATLTALFSDMSVEHSITVPSGSGGSVQAGSGKAKPGAKVSLSVSPNGSNVLKTITISKATGGTVTPVMEGNAGTFSMPACDVTIASTFGPAATRILIDDFEFGLPLDKWPSNFGVWTTTGGHFTDWKPEIGGYATHFNFGTAFAGYKGQYGGCFIYFGGGSGGYGCGFIRYCATINPPGNGEPITVNLNGHAKLTFYGKLAAPPADWGVTPSNGPDALYRFIIYDDNDVAYGQELTYTRVNQVNQPDTSDPNHHVFDNQRDWETKELYFCNFKKLTNAASITESYVWPEIPFTGNRIKAYGVTVPVARASGGVWVMFDDIYAE